VEVVGASVLVVVSGSAGRVGPGAAAEVDVDWPTTTPRCGRSPEPQPATRTPARARMADRRAHRGEKFCVPATALPSGGLIRTVLAL
jgi:hypothetical protein